MVSYGIGVELVSVVVAVAFLDKVKSKSGHSNWEFPDLFARDNPSRYNKSYRAQP